MKVLITIADASCAKVAADFVDRHLLEAVDTELYVLSVVEAPGLDKLIATVYGYPVPPELLDHIVTHQEKLVNDFAEEIQKRLPVNIARKAVLRGRPSDVIVSVCEEWDPDAVVMVHHTTPTYWGSVSHEVARRVGCSVIVLRDFNEAHSERVLQTASAKNV
jgi:nucleotide-binding universal stress UspA family protein